MMPIKSTRSLIVCIALVALVAQSINAEQSNKEVEEQQIVPRGVASNKLLAVPASLTRFFFYNSRPNERQATIGNVVPVGGYKRSSSSLDALTGVTLGKRSAPMELVNYEPVLGRQYSNLRPLSRMYDLRWAPFDSIETPTVNLDNYQMN